VSGTLETGPLANMSISGTLEELFGEQCYGKGERDTIGVFFEGEPKGEFVIS
jgi:hypothetical protein